MTQHKKEPAWGLWISGLAFLLSCKKIYDPDLWWHLAAGRWIYEHRAFIRTDSLSFTAQGLPWTSMTWFYELVIFLLNESSPLGLALITLFHALAIAVAVAFAWKTFEHLISHDQSERDERPVRIGVFLFVMTCMIAEVRWKQRPEALSFALGSALIHTLVVAQARLRWFKVFLIQILWVNTHGLFLFGPLLCVLLSSHWRSRKAENAQVLLASLVACLVNPYGIQGALYPIYLLKVLTDPFFQNTINEATSFFRDPKWGMEAWGFLMWVTLALLGMALWIKRMGWIRSLAQHGGWIVLFLILSWSATQARRNLALFLIFTVPWMSVLWGRACLLISQKLLNARVLKIAILVLMFSTGFDLIRNPGSRERFGFTPAYSAQPLVQFLEQDKSDVQSQLFFSNVEISNELMARWPAYRSYIDGRFAELYPIEHFRRYMDVLGHPALIEEEVTKYGLKGAVLNFATPLAKSFVQYLAHAKGWTLAYFDEAAVVFLKDFHSRSASNFEILHEAAVSRMVAQFESELSLSAMRSHDLSSKWAGLATVSLLMGQLRAATMDQQRASEISSSNPEVWTLRCLVAYLNTESEAQAQKATSLESLQNMEEVCLRSLQSGSDPEVVYQVLGLVYLNTRQMLPAIEYFKRVIRVNPWSFEGHLMLGRALALLGDNQRIDEMRAAYRRAIQLRPFQRDVQEEFMRIELQIEEKKGKTK